jgi:hydroxymethylglutaryl-CoA reductase
MLKVGGLQPGQADNMIENCIGVLPIPLGLVTGLKVNGKNYIVPVAVEEPSVIAANSVIARLIAENSESGFTCKSTPPLMIAQIQITHI